MNKPIIIGVAGGTGSGKSTVVDNIRKEFGDEVTILCHDYYYKGNPNMSYEEKSKLNYDRPDSIDTDMMIADIVKLKAGIPMERPVYSFVNHDREEYTVSVEPTNIILVEGILIFENPKLREQLDIKLFVDTDADVRILRRLRRDINERGRTLDSVISQYLNTVKPMHEQFVEPYKKYADIIIPEGGHNIIALDIVIAHIKSLLEVNEKTKTK